MDIAIVVIYLVAMVAFGFWGKTRTKNSSDFLVAGRRLGPAFYTGTMAAVVLGGASTVGGVALGYEHGISGMWLVVAIAVGLILLSLLFAPAIQRIKVYTVAQMLQLRYGIEGTQASGVIMALYTLMLVVVSTTAYATIFHVLFGTERWVSIGIGAAIVIIYSSIGGMWSITLTDMVQFVIKTIGIFFLLLPFTWAQAGGYDGIVERLGATAGASHFDPFAIGGQSIITFFVIYTLGMLIGQDIWQRVFTARSPEVARWGGTAAGIYCVLYAVAGALIGTAAAALLPEDAIGQDAYAAVAEYALPVGLSGIVLAAAVAAMMSTASGALIACATVARADVTPLVLRMFGKKEDAIGEGNPEHDVKENRLFVLILGIVATLVAMVLSDVIAALTIAYDILVGGLFVAILGGLVWKRGNGAGAVASMIVGTIVTLASMGIYAGIYGDLLSGIYANEPIYWGLLSSAIIYVVVSLATKPTPPDVLQRWEDRKAGNFDESEVEAVAPSGH